MDPEIYDDLAGQVALLTGATRGIGREIASGLAERGRLDVLVHRAGLRPATSRGQMPARATPASAGRATRSTKHRSRVSTLP